MEISDVDQGRSRPALKRNEKKKAVTSGGLDGEHPYGLFGTWSRRRLILGNP